MNMAVRSIHFLVTVIVYLISIHTVWSLLEDNAVEDGTAERTARSIPETSSNSESWGTKLFGSFLSTTTALGQMLVSQAALKSENEYLLGIGETFIRLAREIGGSLRLYLFRSKNPTQGQYFNLTMLQTSKVDLTQDKVSFIIHGFTQGNYFAPREQNQQHSLKIKDAIMEVEESSSVILVDWTYLSSSVEYFSSTKTTLLVGEDLADLLADLINLKLLTLSTTRIIGFSLGAHIAGIIGHCLEQKTGLKLPRIDALDPAGPSFDIFTDMNLQLSQSDASFVQVIHCNTKTFGTSLKTRGHVEFYPNGGQIQPGCDEASVLAKDNSGYPTSIAVELCNHVKCNDIYTKAVTTEQLACPCETLDMFHSGKCNCSKDMLLRMGYFCPPTAAGTYYVNVTLPENMSKIISYFNDSQSSHEIK